jgi:small conductance mechanosensitive channel
MNLFLQLPKPNVEIPEDGEVFGKFESWIQRVVQMSWDDLLHWMVQFGGKLIAALLIYFVGRWLIRKFDGLLNRIFQRRELDPSLNSFIRSIVRIVFWVFLVMMIVGVLGIRTTSFLAILASAGFAVGMALSGTLQNFAGGVLILLLKPFRTGDYIVSQGVEGTVKAINLFNTVLITPDNKTIIIPNGGMSSSIINNVTQSGTRRIEWTFGIAYGDSYEEARRILAGLIESDPRIMRSPDYLIALSGLADSSVQIVVRAWTATADFWDVYYAMNEKVYNAFPKHGLTIPFKQLEVSLKSDALSAAGGERSAKAE